MSDEDREQSEISSQRNGDMLPLQDKNRPVEDDHTKTPPEDHPTKSIGLGRATLLIFSGTTGAGVIAMPMAFKQAGWTGAVLLTALSLTCAYCGVLLGRCWLILLERYPDLTHDVRRPYPLIARMAVGPWMAHMVVACVILTDIGFPTVLVLLISQTLESLFESIGVHFSMCYWLLVMCLLLVPVSWLDTPKDFWWMGILGTLTTVITFVCVMVALFTKMHTGKRGIPERNPSGRAVLLAIGKSVYCLGAASIFPTIQHDMKNPAQFPRAINYYITTWVMFMAVSCFGYIVYGIHLEDSILQNLPVNGLLVTAEVSISVHSLFAIIILLNPYVQAVEGITGVGETFSWKKVLLRTGCVLLVIFIAESMPRFGPILDLIGISSLCFLSMTAPPLFYMCLCSQKGDWTDRSLPLHSKVICIEITVVGILLGIFGTYSAIVNLISTEASTFVLPCYMNANVRPNE